MRCLSLLPGVVCLGVALSFSVGLGGCSGPAKSGGDSGAAAKAAKAMPEPPKERSYDNPDVPLTDKELEDLGNVCEAIADCVREQCDLDGMATRFRTVPVRTTWGKYLVKHCEGHDVRGVARRMGKLAREENLGRHHPDCRMLATRFD